MTLVLNKAETALWYQVVHEAENSCAIVLQEELESYLVFLLMRFMPRSNLADQVMATEFLSGLKLGGQTQKKIALQEVGDTCLIYSGLFPKIAAKRLVKISYFVNLGRSAYTALSNTRNDLYGLLAQDFVPLMDILQSVRQCPDRYSDLLPLEAYELWHETGSQRAFSILKQYSNAVPLAIDLNKNQRKY